VRHFLVVLAFAILAGSVFGTVAKDSRNEQLMYGFKVFAEFMIIGLILGWVLYFLPF
jgi:hypothetical protein